MVEFKFIEEMHQAEESLKPYFDIVRFVDPVLTEIIKNECTESHTPCYAVWGKPCRCRNCLSTRALVRGQRGSKLEMLGDTLYVVIAQPVECQGKKYVLELVTKADDEYMDKLDKSLEAHKIINELSSQIYQDELTGVFNRRYVDETVQHLLDEAQKYGKTLMFALFDTDNLKMTNDRFGHLTGDELLLQLVRTVLSNVVQCGEAFLARMGGDEFLLCMHCEYGAGCQVIEKINDQVRNSVLKSHPEIRPSISIGVAANFELEQQTLLSLLETVDRRMYNAKYAGKGAVCFSDHIK